MARQLGMVSALVCLLAATATAERFQPEVAAGDVAALDEARRELQESIAVGGASAREVSAWRYDWAYLNWRIAQRLRGGDDRRRKALLKEAERQLELVITRSPEDAEAWALRGSVIGDRIDGGFSGAFLGRRASSNHKRAAELDAENPRVALLRGVGFYFTPKTFGGGLEAAEQELRRAAELFARQPDPASWPSWGRADALAWLGVVLVDRGAPDEARELYRSALALEPDNVWIRDRLLPELDAAPEG